MYSSKRAHRGFTLTELMITLAIAGILAMIGAPAISHLLARMQSATAEASIANDLRHARTAAIMNNTRVLMCPSTDGHHCRPDDDWQHGWVLARDADRDGQPDADAPIIASQAAMHAGTRVVTSIGREKVVFHPNGSAAGSNARFTICHAREHVGKSVVVSNSGRVRLEDADAVHLQTCLAGIS